MSDYPACPSPKALRETRDRLCREIVSATKVLTPAAAHWWLEGIQAALDEADGVCNDICVRHQAGATQGHRCCVCNHPQVTTVIYDFGRVCTTCDQRITDEHARLGDLA